MHASATETLSRALEPLVRECALAGLLKAPNQAASGAESPSRDLDVLLVMDRGVPSSYLRLCTNVCQAIVGSVHGAFVFASFRQQVLLRHLARTPEPIPVHLLQYLSFNHLIVREPNTLPENIPLVLRPLGGAPANVAHALGGLSAEAAHLSSRARKIRYYADVIYEAIPLFLNYQASVLPYSVLAEEALHKIGFVMRHFVSEFAKGSQEAAPERKGLATVGPFGESLQARVHDALGAAQSLELLRGGEPPPEQVLSLFRSLCCLLDCVDTP